MSRWTSGGRMRRVLARRTISPGGGPNEGQGLWHQKASAQNPPGYSGRSAPPGVAALVLPQCNTCGMQGHLEEISSQPVHMPSSFWIRRAGTPPAHWISRTISPCCRCRHAARPRSKMSGNICDKTGCQTASLTIRTRSFPSVVTHGTTSPKDHRKSDPLDTENGPMGSNFQELVLSMDQDSGRGASSIHGNLPCPTCSTAQLPNRNTRARGRSNRNANDRQCEIITISCFRHIRAGGVVCVSRCTIGPDIIAC